MGEQAELKQLLEYLERRLRPQNLADIEELSRAALHWRPVSRLPLVLSFPFPQCAHFRPFPHGEIFGDPAKHLYNELVYAFETSIALNVELGCDLPATIRPNFGIGLVASILGARVEQIDDNPPWVHPFPSDSGLREMFDIDTGSVLSRGWLPRVIETYQFYDEVLAPFPNLNRLVKRVLPDLQGPFDNYALVRGGEALSDFYTDPRLLREGLALTAEVQIRAARALLPFTSDHRRRLSYQHGLAMPGNILIRNDSAVMISPDLYRDFIAPADCSVLVALGGGGVHSCGNLEHQMPSYLDLDRIRCIDLGQGLLNDREKLFRLAREKKAALIRMEATEQELATGKVLEMFPTGVSLIHRCGSFEKSASILAAYLKAAQDSRRFPRSYGIG